ncbi:MAG: VCBS repeat-containing protein, partial [Pirellulales bacterium]|nr:VCBS repeat-containing protein [Pirellulales bacterium]
MTQPFNRLSVIEPQGDLDVEAGELWVSNPWELMSEGVNLSAYERNRLFFNHEGREFIDLSYQSGADIDSDSRSAIAADFDRDGDLDLLVASVGGGPLRLFMNQIPSDGKSVRVLLEGTKSNRLGVGARLQIEAGSRRIVRDVFPANGLMGQHPTEAVIGVG